MGTITWDTRPGQASLHRQMKEWGPACHSACQAPPRLFIPHALTIVWLIRLMLEPAACPNELLQSLQGPKMNSFQQRFPWRPSNTPAAIAATSWTKTLAVMETFWPRLKRLVIIDEILSYDHAFAGSIATIAVASDLLSNPSVTVLGCK